MTLSCMGVKKLDTRGCSKLEPCGASREVSGLVTAADCSTCERVLSTGIGCHVAEPGAFHLSKTRCMPVVAVGWMAFLARVSHTYAHPCTEGMTDTIT